MFNKFLNYFLGGSNHYPFINQWHDITNFIKEYVSTNNDVVYVFQIGLSALLIFSILFLLMMAVRCIVDVGIMIFIYFGEGIGLNVKK